MTEQLVTSTKCFILDRAEYFQVCINSKHRIVGTRVLLTAVVLMQIALIDGCTPAPPDPLKGPCGSVRGSATFDGKSLAERTSVLLQREDGFGISGLVDSSGRYEIEKVPVGDYKVGITAPGMAMDGSLPAGDPTKMGGVTIPDKYKSASTSGLSVKVDQDEEKTFDVTLMPE